MRRCFPLTIWIFGFQAFSFDNRHVENDNRRLRNGKANKRKCLEFNEQISKEKVQKNNKHNQIRSDSL